MNIDIYSEIKKAFKDALSEWFEENKDQLGLMQTLGQDGNQTKLLTVKQFCEKHPFISHGGLRHILNFRQWNKFNECIANGTRRVLIKEKEALEWFANPPPESKWTYDRKRYGHD